MAPSFGVRLRNLGPNRIKVMCLLRRQLRLSLNSLKAVVDAGPIEVISEECWTTAHNLADEFERLGAVADVFVSSTGHEHER